MLAHCSYVKHNISLLDSRAGCLDLHGRAGRETLLSLLHPRGRVQVSFTGRVPIKYMFSVCFISPHGAIQFLQHTNTYTLKHTLINTQTQRNRSGLEYKVLESMLSAKQMNNLCIVHYL